VKAGYWWSLTYMLWGLLISFTEHCCVDNGPRSSGHVGWYCWPGICEEDRQRDCYLANATTVRMPHAREAVVLIFSISDFITLSSEFDLLCVKHDVELCLIVHIVAVSFWHNGFIMGFLAPSYYPMQYRCFVTLLCKLMIDIDFHCPECFHT